VKGFRTRPMIFHSCVLYWCITRNSGSYCDNWNKYCSTYLIGRSLIAVYFWLSIYWSGVVLTSTTNVLFNKRDCFIVFNATFSNISHNVYRKGYL
jgi:hypothetical protein